MRIFFFSFPSNLTIRKSFLSLFYSPAFRCRNKCRLAILQYLSSLICECSSCFYDFALVIKSNLKMCVRLMRAWSKAWTSMPTMRKDLRCWLALRRLGVEWWRLFVRAPRNSSWKEEIHYVLVESPQTLRSLFLFLKFSFVSSRWEANRGSERSFHPSPTLSQYWSSQFNDFFQLSWHSLRLSISWLGFSLSGDGCRVSCERARESLIYMEILCSYSFINLLRLP